MTTFWAFPGLDSSAFIRFSALSRQPKLLCFLFLPFTLYPPPMDQSSPSNGNPVPPLHRLAPQSVYGVRDIHGYASLPSRPNSAADSWGKRKDLLRVAKESERMMIEGGKLPERHKLPSPPPTFRLNEEQEMEVRGRVLGQGGRGAKSGEEERGEGAKDRCNKKKSGEGMVLHCTLSPLMKPLHPPLSPFIPLNPPFSLPACRSMPSYQPTRSVPAMLSASRLPQTPTSVSSQTSLA